MRYATVLTLGVLAVSAWLGVNALHVKGQMYGDKIMMGSYLRQMGKKLDCYFTIEQVLTASSPDIPSRYVVPNTSVKSVADLLDYLQKQLATCDIRQSPENPAVIQITSPGAVAIPSYWLDRRIDLSFAGSLADLENRIVVSQQGLEFQKLTAPHGMARRDFDTKVHIVAKSRAVRGLLTDFMPLARYSRTLWTATTTPSDGKQVVTVSFGGPVKAPDGMSDELVPFAQGEDAFYLNKKSPEAIAAAVDYMTTQMKVEKPFQVRWAMFYLGKNGGPAAVPLLIRHLTYKYTTCGVLEESYPAALALSMMGKSGSAAALKAIATETDSLRLKLLCRVVLLVEGQDNGAKAIEAEVVKTTDAQQNQRIRDALKAAAEPQVVPQAPAAK